MTLRRIGVEVGFRVVLRHPRGHRQPRVTIFRVDIWTDSQGNYLLLCAELTSQARLWHPGNGSTYLSA